MNKIHFLKLKGSEWFIMYDGALEDEDLNGISISITDNLNYAQRFSTYEANNHRLKKEGVCDHVYIDKKKTNIDPKYVRLSIFDK